MISPDELQPFIDFLKSRGMSDEDAADAVKFALNVEHVRRALMPENTVVRGEEYCIACDDEPGMVHALTCSLAIAWCALEDPRGNTECGKWWDCGARLSPWAQPRGAPAARRTVPNAALSSNGQFVALQPLAAGEMVFIDTANGVSSVGVASPPGAAVGMPMGVDGASGRALRADVDSRGLEFVNDMVDASSRISPLMRSAVDRAMYERNCMRERAMINRLGIDAIEDIARRFHALSSDGRNVIALNQALGQAIQRAERLFLGGISAEDLRMAR